MADPDKDGYINRKFSIGGSLLTNKSGGMILKKDNFVFDHLNDGSDVKDDYKIGDVLGSGAFGEVRKCVHIKSKTKRAVKIILKETVDQDE
jgi:serine/threonine protein kinase